MFSFVNEATASVSLNQFSIQNSYLNAQGRLTIYSGQATTFNVDFSFIKAGDSYNTVKVVVVYRESGQADLEISNPVWKYDGEWSNSNLMWNATVTCTLPLGKTGGNIYLKYEVWQGSNTGGIAYSGTNYGIGIQSTPGDGSQWGEGRLWTLRSDGRIFHVQNGVARHIQSIETFYGIFVKNPEVSDVSSIATLPFSIGTPIGPNTRIVRDTNDDKIYYQENNTLRYISSPAVATKYSFKISNTAVMTGTAGYIIGAPFY